MNERIQNILTALREGIANVQTKDEMNEIRNRFLGKNGEMNALMKELKNVSAEERPVIGKFINEARNEVNAIIEKKENEINAAFIQMKLMKEKIDITLPSKGGKTGNQHPLSIVKNDVINAFVGLGFSVIDGPEVETDFYSFQALNIPKDHPARDMQDTFYISENVLLRPHTSPAQIRTMEVQKPPIKILCPGRVYRADDDATHSPMFHQIEGLVVDKHITLCDLQGVLDKFAKTIFNEETKIRLRPSFFPFTEPSVEVDVSCAMCHGKGCRICKGTGWIEILGAGMVNNKVLENCGLDPEEYSGFAFGLGIERITMIKYGIPDMRMLFENDVRFLKQFR